ncbi:MAG TPA: FCD domain-containing protein [Sphingomicrobium sp.]|nr:FCD domain-containing protein [Sphingomicrobium sp.]
MNDLGALGGKSLVKTAIDAVKAHIRDHNLHVGDPLPSEGFFAKELGVSRAVMREAFGALGALKLIDVANGRRARVGALDGSVIADSLDHAISTAQIDVKDVWVVRRTIEVETAALAARHASADQAARIVELAERLAHDGDHAHVTEDDIAFHLAIAEASGNALFRQIVMSFVPLMRVAVPKAWQTRRTEEERADILDRHRALARAIADRDPDSARRWMRSHFDESIGALLEVPDRPAT